MSVQAGVWNFDGRPVEPKQIDDIVAYLRQFDSTGKKVGMVPDARKLAKVK